MANMDYFAELQKRLMRSAARRLAHRSGATLVQEEQPLADLYSRFPADVLEQRRFYNVGAGKFAHKWWTNVDYASEHYQAHQSHPFVEFDLNALVPLPIETGSAECIYSSHTIEHVGDAAVANLFREAYRCLKPGGVIRLTTPDAELGYAAYLNKDLSFWYWRSWYSDPGTWEEEYVCPLRDASVEQLFLHHYASQLTRISSDRSASAKYGDEEIRAKLDELGLEGALQFFTTQCNFNPERTGSHINWWTHSKIKRMLREAGFEATIHSGYGQSRFAPLRDTRHFDSTHPAISLYCEAVR